MKTAKEWIKEIGDEYSGAIVCVTARDIAAIQNDALENAMRIQAMGDDELRLQFGEMTAAEIRLVRAIIKCVLAAMSNDQELSHAAGDFRQPETRSEN